DRIMNCMGVMFSDSTHCSTSACPPRIANTPENSAEPTNSQHTMAVVFAVKNTPSLVRFQSSVRAWKASRKAPPAPTPAGSGAGGFGRRRDSEQDDGEDDDRENAERHHRRGQELQDHEAVGVHSPVVTHEHQNAGDDAQPKPKVEAFRRPVFGGRSRSAAQPG